MALGKGHIARYEAYSDTVNGKYISAENVRNLQNRDGVQVVYCQRLCTEIKCQPDQKNRYYTRLTIFNDSLLEKMMELNNITGLDVKNDEIAIVVSFDNEEYQCSDMTLVYEGQKSYGKKYKIRINKILYDADQTGLLGGYIFSSSNHADLIVNEKLAKKIAVKLGDENILSSYTDVLVDCNELVEKNIVQMLLNDVTVVDVEDSSYDFERLWQVVKTAIWGILVLLVLTSFFIIQSIVRTNIITGEEEGIQKTAGEIKDIGKEIMRTAGETFLQACKVAVPVSLAINFFFRFDKFRLVITGYWAGALMMLGGCFVITYIAVKRTLYKISQNN
ncbi:MAG: hypothetical protein NC489_32910 [Ruminococcus flavefaciens]|nr:hypothetical protein [Ruminococcus flavefaciens]